MKRLIGYLIALSIALPCLAFPASALATREVPVDALWFSLQGETAAGGASRLSRWTPHQEISGPKDSVEPRCYFARLISRNATNGRH